MKLYHATTKDYRPGDDLFSLARLLEQGVYSDGEVQEIISRWTDVDDSYLFSDGTLISFTPDLQEAHDILKEFNGGQGVILCVDSEELEAEGLLTTNSEGYPAAAYGRVDARLLTVLE